MTVKVRKPTNIVLDIYGTMTSLKFINELQEYAKKNIEKYLREHWTERRMNRLLERLRKEIETLEDKEEMPILLDSDSCDSDDVLKSFADHCIWRINTHQESNSTMYLCEKIWEEGYNSKELKSHIFEDVPIALNDWRMNHFIKIYTLSTGDKKGQNLFFKSTIHGDLTPLIANYLDATAFGKEDPRCYANISQALRDKAEHLLFITDNPKEARAALSQCFQVVLIIRDGNKPLTEEETKEFNVVRSFEEIEFTKHDAVNCC
ncbi:enolase-phosphatase E1-like protein 7 [Dinothrombium tinctorium]|uniref:Enolase-phosphatase E1-like protein 7 n=1 Tax=Dinothrombium tinctorium TaxID=1965070 RepID=A0A3S3P896_9ACAR|nr:enolase-phosphatase E1-like protein 7 [Dinothrombium tinctorium]